MSVIVGTSELPGRTFGKPQVMSNVQAGWNLIAALAELRRDHGLIVTVNEADRSREDQIGVRQDYIGFLNGGPWAPLAAFCTWGPPPQFTSTHDPLNYGNAADLGGPGGAVISDRARDLLDGNHPDGVIGRKYGLRNTGWNFSRREIWHFNIYPDRAQVLAPNPSVVLDHVTPNITKEQAMKIKWIDESKSKGARQGIVGEPGSGIAKTFTNQTERDAFFNALDWVWGIKLKASDRVPLFRGSYNAAMKIAKGA
ncbi:hypothetical protein ITJ50_00955 [Curtobacterium sp. VKM Ac-2889]|uniref:hypothetical protein n=1 Tax=unclassified Curtobacterium TaxID=257496 RepID=UPI00188BE009|nr:MULTISPECIES: hypothetical protein [unclassified Curtobacterium]MBF4597169.1 hypothetical protein [Curtobacterium sp. VKM Ac-1796]MBF4609787.1 hypothetical protein [Curtobacterium sp. VKM Ac-2889]